MHVEIINNCKKKQDKIICSIELHEKEPSMTCLWESSLEKSFEFLTFL